MSDKIKHAIKARQQETVREVQAEQKPKRPWLNGVYSRPTESPSQPLRRRLVYARDEK